MASAHAASTNVTEYDPLWVEKTGFNRATVESFQSRMKFDDLYKSQWKVLRTGDLLVINVEYEGQHDRKAELTIMDNSTKDFPNLGVNIVGAPQASIPDILDCHGTNKIKDHLRIHGAKTASSADSFWKHIEIVRERQPLGSLDYMKKSFHFWRDEKDKEAALAGVKFRIRRPRGKKVPEGHVTRNGILGKWDKKGRGKVFKPAENQAQWLPKG